MPKHEKILFLVPYPQHRAPSQRFRVELFLPFLMEKGIHYRVESFLDENTWLVLYNNTSLFKKIIGVVKGFMRRIYVLLFVVPGYSYVFVHREASPVGPPIFEFLISKVWRKRLIYDFDDAIWIPNTSKENKIVNWVKAFWKVKYICRWSYKVVGGNEYLCAYARKYNAHTILIPTCVDVVKHHNRVKDQQTNKVIIGWTGSHSTSKFLDDLVPLLKKIIADFKVEIHIISNKPPQFSLPGLTFVPWREVSEIEDLLQFNIGIMPLKMDAWGEGKCGFKLIQYLALGIPAVASPVGVNKSIIDDGVQGFLCETYEQWYKALAVLIKDEQLRTSLGAMGREKIRSRYSIQANVGAFVGLFK